MKEEKFKTIKERVKAQLGRGETKDAINTLLTFLKEEGGEQFENQAITLQAKLAILIDDFIINAFRIDWDAFTDRRVEITQEVLGLLESIDELIQLEVAGDQYREKLQDIAVKLGRLAVLLGLSLVADPGSKFSSFTDPRVGKTYKTVKLNGITWMAENLNFDVGEGCWFYDNDPKHGKKYGRLYTWEAAKKACPPGWRLPTDGEWKELAQSFGGYWDWGTLMDVGDPKKAFTALMEGGSSGLSAQLGGFRNSNGSFFLLGDSGYYWSATEFGSDRAWLYTFTRSGGKLYRDYRNKTVGRSCRCVQGS